MSIITINASRTISMNVNNAVTVARADVLLRELAAAGWQPGAPPAVSLATQATDRRFAAALRCPGCGCRGMTYHPLRREGAYRALAACGRCGAAEEL